MGRLRAGTGEVLVKSKGDFFIVLKDQSGNHWRCRTKKETFEMLPENRPLEVTNEENTTKKFLKGFLQFESEIVK